MVTGPGCKAGVAVDLCASAQTARRVASRIRPTHPQGRSSITIDSRWQPESGPPSQHQAAQILLALSTLAPGWILLPLFGILLWAIIIATACRRMTPRRRKTRSHPMATSRRHSERHRTDRIGWLRAAVLGANDGIVSTASLVLGVAAASATPANILVTGVAGLVAGAMSMAAGEFVSVHSQADTEASDLARERIELQLDPVAEQRELAAIYVHRGLDATLAQQVAGQLMRHDALGAHARDELGISEAFSARPVQAALSSAASFAVGAALPLAATALAPERGLMFWVAGASLVFLALLGALAARVGGAPIGVGAWRVTFWGALAMGITAAVGAMFGAVA